MKCERCGKRVANYHYMSNVNGKVTEQHLCDQCAAELEGRESVFASAGRMFDRMFSDFWDDGFGRMAMPGFGGFGGFFGAPVGFSPCIQLTPERPEASVRTAAPAAEPMADPEMAKKRQINVLREQIRAAVEKEEYEKAAQLRDQLHELEK